MIDHNFKYHAPTSVKVLHHESVREACRNLAHTLDTLIPNSREKSLAITKLEEVMMWANAGIARNEVE